VLEVSLPFEELPSSEWLFDVAPSEEFKRLGIFESPPSEVAAGTICNTIVANAIAQIQGGEAYINLDNHGLSAFDARTIAEALPGSSLTRLDLDNNSIGDSGAQVIAAVLADCNLMRLDLYKNDIGDAGAAAFAAVLADCKLTTLFLNGNQISGSQEGTFHRLSGARGDVVRAWISRPGRKVQSSTGAYPSALAGTSSFPDGLYLSSTGFD
jgi:hypothetical protein